MEEIDKLVNALYLAKSDNREGMLSDLVMNTLYAISEPLTSDEIIDYIKFGFHLEPIKFEVQNQLDHLVEKSEIRIVQNKYVLNEVSKQSIHAATIRAKEESNKRFVLFTDIVNEIFKEEISTDELKHLWSVFNEYLLECFMVFGRKAINIFLPYNEANVTEDSDIHKIAINKLKSEKLQKLFKVLVVEYPERLSDLELRYLSTLTSRAERFYSLGIEKSEYEKIKSLKIENLVVLLDTNVLYSILNLRVHPEKAAIFELIKLSKEKIIDLKLVYVPKTYSELIQAKGYIESAVLREKFRPGQIKALLCSDELDSFARNYFEAKLINSDAPHPAETIKYASDILKSKGISIYNDRFDSITEDPEYLNNKIAEYLDFQRYFNNLNEERGYELRLNKTDKKIEHDIFLREAVGLLKSKFNAEDDLNFICLTLDNSILHFDQYTKRKLNAGLHKSINPSFIFPSTLLKRLRPFIPIISQDYRKAFITSLTAPSFEFVKNSDSLLIQKSMAYFKEIGIEDEDVIISCIRRELFLKDFEREDSNGNGEAYIKTELAKELDSIKAKMNTLAEEIKQKESDKKVLLLNSEHEKSQLEQKKEVEKEEILKSKNKEVNELNNDIKDRDNFIDGLAKRIRSLETINHKIANRAEFELDKNNWLVLRENFVNQEWQKELIKLQESSRYFLLILFITFIPVLLAIVIKIFGENMITKIELYGISQWYLWLTLCAIQLFEIFGRTYLFDKEKVKAGKKWLCSSGAKKMENIISVKKQGFIDEFERLNKQPELQDSDSFNNSEDSNISLEKVS